MTRQVEQLVVAANSTVPLCHGAASTSLLEMLAGAAFAVKDRTKELESDTAWLQLVAYGVVHGVRGDGERVVLAFLRGTTEESRLTGLRSLGVGGHVNSGDMSDNLSAAAVVRAVLSAASRELKEEVPGCVASITDISLRGVVRTLDDNVGLSHLGAVFLAEVSHPTDEMFAGSTLRSPAWVPVSALLDDGFWEGWSRQLLPLVQSAGYLCGPDRVQRFHRLWQSLELSTRSVLAASPSPWYSPERDVINLADGLVTRALGALSADELAVAEPVIDALLNSGTTYDAEAEWSRRVAAVESAPYFDKLLRSLGNVLLLTATKARQLKSVLGSA